MPDDQIPVPLASFAATLRPRQVDSRTVRSRRAGDPPQTIGVFVQGHEDEIWLKLLEVKHGIERHTAAEWHKLIDRYRDEPAHPADPRYGR